MKGNVKKVLRIVKNTVLIVLFLACMGLAYQSIKLRTDVNYIPNVMGKTYLNVLSDSMNPEFKVMDLVIGDCNVNSKELKEGDIITFRDGQRLVTHRIIEIKDNGQAFVTKGDANELVDRTLVKPEYIVSKVTNIIPKGGYVVSKFQDFTFLGFVWIILMYALIKEISIEIKKHREKVATN